MNVLVDIDGIFDDNLSIYDGDGHVLSVDDKSNFKDKQGKVNVDCKE